MRITKTNYYMLREFDFKPKQFGILSDDEVKIITEHFQIKDRSDRDLQNFRDFVVMYYSRKEDMESYDIMSGIVGVIDGEKMRRGLEV